MNDVLRLSIFAICVGMYLVNSNFKSEWKSKPIVALFNLAIHAGMWTLGALFVSSLLPPLFRPVIPLALGIWVYQRWPIPRL